MSASSNVLMSPSHRLRLREPSQIELDIQTRYSVPALSSSPKSEESENQPEATHQIAVITLAQPESPKQAIRDLHQFTPKLQEEISEERLIRVIDFIEKNWSLLQSVYSKGGGIIDRCQEPGFPPLDRTLYVSPHGEVFINCKKRTKNGRKVQKIVGKGGFKTITMAILYNPPPNVSRLMVIGITKLNNQTSLINAEKEKQCGLLFKHENIVQIHTSIYYVGSPKKPVLKQGLYMPYYNSPDLFVLNKNFVQINVLFPRSQAGLMSVSILKAVEYIHQKGYIHFDLKLENIFINILKTHDQIYFVPYVGDFGMAKKADSLTLDTKMEGSDPYVAPELWDHVKSLSSDSRTAKLESLSKISHKCDVYALGVIFGIIYYKIIPSQNPITNVWNEFYRKLIEPKHDTMLYLIWRMTQTDPVDRVDCSVALQLLNGIINPHIKRREITRGREPDGDPDMQNPLSLKRARA